MGSCMDQERPWERAERDQIASKAGLKKIKRAMKEKLDAARLKGRGGWQDKDDCSQEHLSQLLREHVEKGDPVDVANFCMMLHARGEGILPVEPKDKRPPGWIEAMAISFMAANSHDPEIGAFAKAFNEGAWREIEKEWPEFVESVGDCLTAALAAIPVAAAESSDV